MESFIPQNAYARMVGGSSKYNILIDDKILFHDTLSYYGLPVPKRFFILRKGELREGSRILDGVDVDNILSRVSENRIFVKRFTGGAASGISVLSKDSNGNWVTSNNSIVNSSTIKSIYGGDGYIFEQQISQNKELSKINHDSVNTIRILTYKNEIISASIRFGGKGSFVDNISAGGVAVSINLADGSFGEYGMRMYDIKYYSEHPDSKIRFKGLGCPYWPEIKSLVSKTLKFLPYYTSVGFDIAVSEKGPLIVEINTGAGVGLSQIGKEEGLADIFYKK